MLDQIVLFQFIAKECQWVKLRTIILTEKTLPHITLSKNAHMIVVVFDILFVGKRGNVERVVVLHLQCRVIGVPSWLIPEAFSRLMDKGLNAPDSILALTL